MSAAEERYRGDLGRSYHEGKRGLPPQSVPWVARLRADKLGRWMPSAAEVVFEYGVGSGWNLAALSCRRKLGYDVADFLEATLCSQGIECVQHPEVLPDGLADVVLCYHTLEHVLAPHAALEEMHRLLRSTGRLILFTPWERERRYRTFHREEPNHHLYTWNAQTLGNLVEQCGFRTEQTGVGRYGYDRFAAVWACRMRLGEAGFRWLRAALVAVRPLWETRVIAARV